MFNFVLQKKIVLVFFVSIFLILGGYAFFRIYEGKNIFSVKESFRNNQIKENSLGSFTKTHFGFDVDMSQEELNLINVKCDDTKIPKNFGENELGYIVCQGGSRALFFTLGWKQSKDKNNDYARDIANYIITLSGSEPGQFSCKKDKSFSWETGMPAVVADCSLVSGEKTYFYSILLFYPNKVKGIDSVITVLSLDAFPDKQATVSEKLRMLANRIRYIKSSSETQSLLFIPSAMAYGTSSNDSFGSGIAAGGGYGMTTGPNSQGNNPSGFQAGDTNTNAGSFGGDYGGVGGNFGGGGPGLTDSFGNAVTDGQGNAIGTGGGNYGGGGGNSGGGNSVGGGNSACLWCSSLSGTACSSPQNVCGDASSGVYDCNGVCSASVSPALPANYGQSCSKTSAPNNCGDTNTNYGTYNCSSLCNAIDPVQVPNRWFVDVPCLSAPNRCGMRGTGGKYQCNGTCSSTKPADTDCPPTYNDNKPIVSLSASPENLLSIVPVTLSWTIGNNPTACWKSSSSGVAGWNNVSLFPLGNGSDLNVLVSDQVTSFTLSCSNASGTTSQTVYVRISNVCDSGTFDCGDTNRVCAGQQYIDKNGCGMNCTGSRYCDFNWKEASPTH